MAPLVIIITIFKMSFSEHRLGLEITQELKFTCPESTLNKQANET